MLRDDEAEQHPPQDPKNAFLGIDLDAICSEFHEGLLKIGYEVVSPFGLNHDVVNVGLNGPPDEVPKHLSIQRWYVALEFFSPNGIET